MANLIRRLFIFWIISSIIIAGLVFGVIKFYGEPFVKDYIETTLAEKLSLNIKVAEVKIKFIPPISLRLEGLSISNDDGTKTIEAESASVFVDILKVVPSLPELNINAVATIVKPIATIKIPIIGTQQVTVPAGSMDSISVELPGGLNLSLDLDIQDGTFAVLKQNESKEFVTLFKGSKSFVNLKSRGLDRDIELSVFTNVAAEKLSKSAIPLELKSKLTLDLAPLMMKIASANLRIGGIPGNVTGVLNPVTMKYNLDVDIDVTDLGKIRSFAFPGTWQGALNAKIKAQQSDKLKVVGTVQAKSVYGDLEYSNEDTKLSGSMGINGLTTFTYADSFKIDSMTFAANLTNMAISYQEFFKKDRAVTLTALGNLSQDQTTLKINTLKFDLAHLKGSFSGHFGTGKAESNFKLGVSKTPLAGLEKFFPMIRTPLTGSAEANVEVRGNLAEPKSLFIDVNPLVLEQVKVDAFWKSSDETRYVEGALLVNTRSNFRIQNELLLESSTETQIDFTRVGMIWANSFIKPLGNILRLNLSATQKDKFMQISKAELMTAAGVLDLTGSFRDPTRPDMKLKMHTAQMDLTRLTAMLPVLKKWKLSGKIMGHMALEGRYEPNLGIETSNLKMDGNLKAFLPEFAYIPEVPVEGKPIAQPEIDPKKKKTPAVLPPWPILVNSSLRTEVTIGKLFYKDIILDGVKWRGALLGGTLVGQLDVKEVFGGTLIVGKLRIPMKDAQPTTQLNAVWGNMQAGKAFDWFLPTWKGLFNGVANGSIDMILLHPDNPDFTLESVVRGKGTLKNGFFSSIKFDQMVNQKLSQIPGIGSQANFASKGVAGNIDFDFEFHRSMLRFRNFDMVTPEKNEFHGVGWIKTDKTMDISGKAHIKGAPVQGSVLAANSDKEGRLVVPVQFAGTVMDPQLNIADQTIKTMLTKTAEYEGAKLKNEAQKALNTEADKVKKKVGEELSKGLKNLLGK